MEASLSIIIVNYRSWYHLRYCLQSLLTEKNKYEIIVVDNHSEDDLFVSFKSEFPTVLFIESETNLGFGGGCHLGVLKATNEYLLFLNPDTIAREDSIKAMLDFISTNKNYGIVSCRQHTNLRKHFLLLPNLLRLSGLWRSLVTNWNKKKIFDLKNINGIEFIEPEWVSASVLMMPKELYYEVGGWSKKLWMYYEDPDLCNKVCQLGLKIALLSNFFIHHEHGGATRLNKKTAVISKAEVVISRHVYIQDHFKGVERIAAHAITTGEVIALGTLKSCIGLIFFFIPILNIHTHIWINLIRYYVHAIKNKSWFSPQLNKQ